MGCSEDPREDPSPAPCRINLPAISTVRGTGPEMNLNTRGRKPLHHAQGTTLSRPHRCERRSVVWTIKGEFMLASNRCYPLTITDFASRYLICCDALETTKGHAHLPYLKGFLRTLGCPYRSAATTVCPFASASAFFGLSRLSVVAALGNRHRAHQARQSTAERSPRADAASHPEEGNHQTAWQG